MTENHPKVFLDISIDNNKIGRIVIELYADKVPRTCDNFRVLCTGEKGVGRSGSKLHFKGCKFHKIIPNFIIQSGDFITNDGSSNESIYGKAFEDENFSISHNEPGIVSMANSGRNTNGGQFFITLTPATWLDHKNVAFGKVIEGMNIVQQIGETGTKSGTPTKTVEISDCGEM